MKIFMCDERRVLLAIIQQIRGFRKGHLYLPIWHWLNPICSASDRIMHIHSPRFRLNSMVLAQNLWCVSGGGLSLQWPVRTRITVTQSFRISLLWVVIERMLGVQRR